MVGVDRVGLSGLGYGPVAGSQLPAINAPYYCCRWCVSLAKIIPHNAD
jgi:hypothetical protein